MTINHEALNVPSGNTQWESLTALADKMGELDASSPKQEDLEASRHEFLNLIDVLNDDTITAEEKEALIAKWNSSSNSKKVWSREFIDSIKEKVGEDVAAYELMDLGMPAKFILENEDYYNEMIEAGSSSYYDILPPGAFSEFYYAMQTTEDDKSKFQKDFIESGLAQKHVSGILLDLKYGKHDDSIIADLKIAKSFGMSMLSGDLYANGEEQQREQVGRDLANFLNDNGLLDGKDVASVYEKILSGGFFRIEEFGIIDVAIKEGIEIETDDPDAEYWHSLSLQQKSKENMLHKFVSGIISDSESEMIHKSFDFAQEPVMRVFARKEVHSTGDYTVRCYQNQQFREALKQPVFQDIIMQTLEKKRGSYRPFLGETPSLFLMLAQDRQILDDMRARGAFDQYEICKEIEAIGKISSGDYDERYRLGLFLDEEFLTPELFDEQGEPNDDFIRKMGSWVDKYRISVRNSYCLDFDESCKLIAFKICGDLATCLTYFDENGPKPEFWQKSLENKEYDFLSRLDDETKAKMGFDKTTMGFLNSFGTLSGSRLIHQLDPTSIPEYFDENGPKPEFWKKA